MAPCEWLVHTLHTRTATHESLPSSSLCLGRGGGGGGGQLLSLVRRVNASAELVTLLNEQAQAAYTAELEAFNHRVQRGSAPDDGPLTPPVPATEVEWPESLDSGGYTRPEAQAARAAVTSAEDAVATLSGEVSTLERQSEEDYGPNHEWWSLRDRCVESTSSKCVAAVVGGGCSLPGPEACGLWLVAGGCGWLRCNRPSFTTCAWCLPCLVRTHDRVRLP